jgi:hypothetical protein
MIDTLDRLVDDISGLNSKLVLLIGSPLGAWLAEACLRYSGRALTVTNLEANPIIYPFVLGGSAVYLLSKARGLEMRVDSSGSQVVALAS